MGAFSKWLAVNAKGLVCVGEGISWFFTAKVGDWWIGTVEIKCSLFSIGNDGWFTVLDADFLGW